MQNLVDRAFMQLVAHYGAPDCYVAGYFRVHSSSRLDAPLLRCITENETGRPVFAQLVGHDPESLARTARELTAFPTAGVDLNLGCAAPKILRKQVGGGLLRDPARIDEILAALREAVAAPTLLTVKTRIGFDGSEGFPRLLELLDRHRVDLVTVHGRTVTDGYRGPVRSDAIALAVSTLSCPVIANGEITSAARARAVLSETGAHGLMIGRHAIRNPWIFRHCRELFAGLPLSPVTLADVREYVERLYRATSLPSATEAMNVAKMKGYLNYLGPSIDADGAFLHDMRRARSEHEIFTICDRHLLSQDDRPFALEPHAGVFARPKTEGPEAPVAAS
jgi:tRNA-dihydrouridine synthase